jgi:hypothetical protein
MRRIAVVLAGAVLLVACSNDPPPQGDSPPLVKTSPPTVVGSPTPSGTPSITPTDTTSESPELKVADTLCARMDQAAMRRILRAGRIIIRTDVTPAFGVPTYDVCSFAVSGTGGKTTSLQVGASVLPATRADLAKSRRAYDVMRGRTVPARNASAGQGGYGTSGFVVFLSSGRLVKVSGTASFAQSLAVAREAAKRTAELPPVPLKISKPECDRAGSPAAKVLGGPALVRRDRVNQYGDIECGWASATRAVSSSATRISGAEQLFEQNSRKPGTEPVPLGDDGADKVASFMPAPSGQGAKNDMIAFALRLSGLYTR